jgi:hypothetical protein
MKRYLGTPFHCIGGLAQIPSPSAFHRVQTDGFFDKRYKGRVAAIIYTPTHHIDQTWAGPIRTISSTETDWASVAIGLRMALEFNHRHLGIENNNLEIIRSLIFYRDVDFKNKRNQDYARYYFHDIMKSAAQTEWTGVRWIPRGLNRADDLSHK